MLRKTKTLILLSFIYWIIQALSLLSIKGFDDVVLRITSICILAFLTIGILSNNVHYKIILSSVLILYSIFFCCFALLCIAFIRPPVFQYLIIVMAILNLIISIFMLKIHNKHLKNS